MAKYRRRYSKKKRYYRTNKNKSTRSIAYRALRKASKISRAVEMKRSDQIFNMTTIDDDGNVYTLSPQIEQGLSDANDRIGDSIQLTSLNARIFFNRGVSTSDFVRLIIFIDKHNSITDPLDMLINTGQQQSICSPYGVDERRNWRVLHDKVYNISNNLRQAVFIHKYIKLRCKTQYLNNGTTPTRNAIKFAVLSDAQSTATDKPFGVFFSRLNYRDC